MDKFAEFMKLKSLQRTKHSGLQLKILKLYRYNFWRIAHSHKQRFYASRKSQVEYKRSENRNDCNRSNQISRKEIHPQVCLHDSTIKHAHSGGMISKKSSIITSKARDNWRYFPSNLSRQWRASLWTVNNGRCRLCFHSDGSVERTWNKMDSADWCILDNSCNSCNSLPGACSSRFYKSVLMSSAFLR